MNVNDNDNDSDGDSDSNCNSDGLTHLYLKVPLLQKACKILKIKKVKIKKTYE